MRGLAVVGTLLAGMVGCGSEVSGPGSGEPPELQLTVPSQAEVGVPVAVSYRAEDESGLAHLSIAWGDGSAAEIVPLQGRAEAHGTLEHVYGAPGEFELTVTLVDSDDLSTERRTSLSIRSVPTPSVEVSLDRGTRFQTMTGWGFSLPSAASMNLGLNPLSSFPFQPGGEDRIFRLLFDRTEGLGMTHMAFFLGWDIEGFWSGREQSTFEETNDNPDPFDIDFSGMTLTSEWPNFEVVKRAAREGAQLVPKMSAPGWMKSGTDLREDMAEELAEHILAFVLFARDSVDVTFSHLVPHNEPNTTGTTRIDPALLTAVMRSLTERFERGGIETLLVAPETSTLHAALPYSEDIVGDPTVRRRLGGLSTHPYGGNDPGRWRQFAELAGRQSLSVWQGEWSTAETTGGLEFGIEDGLVLAGDILEHLVAGDVSAWFNLFGPVCDCGEHRGTEAALIVMEPTGGGGYDVELPVRYHAVAQFSRFVRPGATRIGAVIRGGDVEAVAFESPAGDPVVVLVNPMSSDVAVELTGAGDVSGFQRTRTSATEPATPVGSVPVSDGRATVVLPGRSITTLHVGSG